MSYWEWYQIRLVIACILARFSPGTATRFSVWCVGAQHSSNSEKEFWKLLVRDYGDGFQGILRATGFSPKWWGSGRVLTQFDNDFYYEVWNAVVLTSFWLYSPRMQQVSPASPLGVDRAVSAIVIEALTGVLNLGIGYHNDYMRARFVEAEIPFAEDCCCDESGNAS